MSCSKQAAHKPRDRDTKGQRGLSGILIVLQPRLWPDGRLVEISWPKEFGTQSVSIINVSPSSSMCQKGILWRQNLPLWSGDVNDEGRISRSGCRLEVDVISKMGVSCPQGCHRPCWTCGFTNCCIDSLWVWCEFLDVFSWKSCLGRGKSHGLHYVDCLVSGITCKSRRLLVQVLSLELRCKSYTKSKWSLVASLK